MSEINQDFWENNAELWGQAIQSQLIESRKITGPAIVNEIVRETSRRNSRSVLDLGCGEGWIASALLEKGFHYTGLDFSTRLIEIARRSHPGGSFETASYDDIIRGTWKNTREFDVIVFNFSLFDQNICPILRKASSLLRASDREPSGTILIQTLHPFSVSKDYPREYKNGWRTEDFKSFPMPFNGKMPWYFRTLSSWFRTILESGHTIKGVTEPIDPVSQGPLSIIFSLGARTKLTVQLSR